MSVGAFSGTLVWVSLYDVAPHWLALILAFVVGGAMAGIFGVIVGVPVLRLSGDYLAIVTLAFGEIIKNIMNAVYLGVDDSGLHFSLKDAASMNMAEDGKILINGAMGITGIKDFHLYHGHYSGAYHAGGCAQPDPLPRWPRYLRYPR